MRYHDEDGNLIPSVMYPDFLEQTLNEYVPNKTVLAIGSSAGIEDEIVKDLHATSLFTVDPHVKYSDGGDIIPDFYGTANDYYKQDQDWPIPEFDVVLCMGLLYHLHSPFHLLEQIVNLSKPKVLIVESLMKEYGQMGYFKEIDMGHAGAAHADVGIKYPLELNNQIPHRELIRALESTPLTLHKFYEYSRKTEDFSEMVPLYYEDEGGDGDSHSDIGTRKNGMFLAIFKEALRSRYE